MKYLTIILILLYPLTLYSFERGGWPGEGEPVLSYKFGEYVIYSKPDNKSENQIWKVKKGKRIKFINSKYITIKPVIMEVTQDILIKNSFTRCGGSEILLKKGDIIINYQYAAEGFYEVEIKGKDVQCQCQFELYKYKSSLNNADKKPVAEWWIQIKNSENKKGWLKITSDNVTYHQRMF